MFILGIDIGTSACKIAAFDQTGNLAAEATRPYKVYHPRQGWAEQNPDEWYEAVCSGLKEVCAKVGNDQICAVGIDGQSWSCIPVDSSGKVLANTPIWYDTRAEDICRELEERVGYDRIFSVCGNPIQPSYTTPKALWFARHCPDVYRNARYLLQSNSFIGYRLTGIATQDRSQGYGHFFYSVADQCYDTALAEEIGVDADKFAPVVDCHSVIGTVTDAAARETGLRPGTPVVAGGLDAACGTLGAGVVSPGQTQEQGGQAGGMSICMDSPKADKRLILGSHVVPGTYLLQGGTVAGGAALRWFDDAFGAAFADTKTFAAIDREAAQVPPGSEGVVFLPYLNGERSPLWNPKAKGVFYGITFSTTRAHMARAVMEGVAFALRHNIETAIDAGASVDRLYAMGGASNSTLWTQIKSDVTSLPISVPNSDYASTLGAALLAGVGIGMYSDFKTAVEQTVALKRSHTPEYSNKSAYDCAYQTYRAVYENLKEVMSS